MANDSKQKFGLLPDVPVGISLTGEARPRTDGLKRGAFVRVLAGAVIETSDTLTVGIYGDWGTGKTSVMGLMKDVVDHPDSGAVGVWFNAWQYEREEHLIVPLIATINKAIEERMGKFKGAPKKAIKEVHKALRSVAYGFSFKGKAEIPLLAGSEVSLSGKDMIDRYQELAGDAELERSLYFEAFEKLRKVSSGQKKSPKVVVFVDDLDRCLPKSAVELLENIKLVMNLPNFSFVLGIAPAVIEEYVRTQHYKDLKLPPGYLRKYLDKFVQVPIEVPPPPPRVMREHIEQLIDREDSFTTEESRQLKKVGNIVSRLSEGNPRNVVRTMNQVLVLYRVREEVRKGQPGEAEVPMAHLAFANELFKVRVALISRTIHLRRNQEETARPSRAAWKTDPLPRGEGLPDSQRYEEADWTDSPDGVLSFGEGLAWTLVEHLTNPDDPLPTGFREKLLTLREINDDFIVREALNELSKRLPICCALRESPEGLAWLADRNQIQLSFELTRTVMRAREEEDSMLEDWEEIERRVRQNATDPFSFDQVCDFVTNEENLYAELPHFVKKFARNLSNLSRRTQAQFLNLSGCSLLEDLLPLEKLTALQRLNLGECERLERIQPLEKLTKLQILSLSYCQRLKTLQPLEKLTKLSALYLFECRLLRTLQPIEKLTTLNWLYLPGCIGLTEVPHLENLTHLWGLDLSRCGQLETLQPLKTLRSLRSLDLSGCTQLESLELVAELRSLEDLTLEGCTRLTDPTPLEGLPNARSVNLSGCTGIKPEQVDALRKKLPDTEITYP